MGITDSPGFCVLPWIHLNLNPDGASTLCCQSPGTPIFEDGRPLNAQTHTLAEIWNSDGLKDLRRRMAMGEELPQCAACFRDEHYRGQSYRTQVRDKWLDGNPTLKAAIEAAPDWTSPGDPLYLDIRFGNLCNLKCTICKPLYSSQIERDPAHAPWVIDAPYQRLPSRFEGETDWSQADALVDEITALSGSVQLIQLAGGEPTVNKGQMRWLRRLGEQGRASDIDLEVTTNLSNLHPEVLETFRRFKSLMIVVSIDGTGATYEYVRFPSKWESLTRNVARLKSVCPDAKLSLNFVLQTINAFNIVDVFEWAQDQDLYPQVYIGRGLDRYNDFRILPPAGRNEIRARIAAYFHRNGNRDFSVLQKNVAAIFDETDETDFTEEQRQTSAKGFMHFVNDMDRSRGLSFKTAAPEVYSSIADYHGGWDESCRHALAG